MIKQTIWMTKIGSLSFSWGDCQKIARMWKCYMKEIMGKIREQSVGDRRDINRKTISYASFFLMQHDYK